MFDFRHSSLKSLDLTFKFSKTRALIPLMCSWYIYIYIYIWSLFFYIFLFFDKIYAAGSGIWSWSNFGL